MRDLIPTVRLATVTYRDELWTMFMMSMWGIVLIFLLKGENRWAYPRGLGPMGPE